MRRNIIKADKYYEINMVQSMTAKVIMNDMEYQR